MTPSPPQDMPSLKAHLCQLAEQIASDFDTRLDYSVDSIKQVEQILASFHEYYQSSKSEEGLNGVAMEFGAYIATVIDRRFGPATLEFDHPTFGSGAFPLYWRGSTLFPSSWCQKRIFDGSADDVWLKFHTLVLNHESNKQK